MTSTRTQYILRYALFFLGVNCIALGVAFTTRANLGTAPISSLPYVASLGFAPSLGVFTILVNLGLVGLQIIILRRAFPPIQLLQIPTAFAFGFFVDLWMPLVPDATGYSYIYKLLLLGMGVVILGFGVFAEVSANVVMMPGEGSVMAIAIATRKDFGILKTLFDCSMVLLAILLSLLLFFRVEGVREGTVLSAIFVGLVAKLFFRLRYMVRPQVAGDM